MGDFTFTHALTLTISIVGWSIVFYISNRALKRADISRSKDACIATAEEAVKKLIELKEKDNPSATQLEFAISYFAVKLSFKLKTLNELAGVEIGNSTNTTLLFYESDPAELLKNEGEFIVYTQKLLNLCESIENSYRELFFKSRLASVYVRRSNELKGAAFGLLIMVLLFSLFKLF